jgi:hypothetical protein
VFTRVGKVLRLVVMILPPLPGLACGLLKLKTKSLSSGSRKKWLTVLVSVVVNAIPRGEYLKLWGGGSMG